MKSMYDGVDGYGGGSWALCVVAVDSIDGKGLTKTMKIWNIVPNLHDCLEMLCFARLARIGQI